MGHWGTGIFENDIAADVKDLMEELLEQGLSIDEATAQVLDEYEDELEDEEDRFDALLAIAQIQISHGALQEEIGQAVLELIDSGVDALRWQNSGGEEERQQILAQLRACLADA